ncbi:MAG: T9SS type A sorting domain-containing protein, partial [Candidatus Marinimicrobia bacterium]|nr:T9SS type A sorting domain-containing protein [Candidatus Neomarinimicrobiota bacterium]
YLLVWCDNDAGQAGLHAFFKLNAGGEYLALVADDGATIIDFVSFGTQTTDISFGRYPDASDNWASLTPTPGDGNIILMVKDMAVPTDFLIAVYPNPFNAAATIDFTLPQPTTVSLKVYDLLGREVVTLHQGWQDAGYHNVVWEGKDRSGQAVASGIYFAVIQTENTVRTVKMVLLK